MQSINLQITPSGVMPVVNASQYDYGRLVQFNLYDGASAYIPPEGTEIRVEGRKSDGTVFSYFANYVGNAVIVTLTQQMTVLAENVPCELRLYLNNEDIGTVNFTLAVEPSNIGMAVVSETEIPAIIALARRQELNSEAWANGTRGGVPVSPDNPAYQNNAKWWAEHADLGTLENLLDVDIDSLTNGQIIKYNSETGKWENADEEGGGASSLGDLTDVSLNSPSNKQVLMFNYLQQKWENGDAPSGGMTSHIIVESEAGESSVTVTLPSGTVKTCTQVSGSTTQWETTSDEYGTHIIDAYKDGDDAQASLNIQYVGEYLVHDEHYFHTINVTVKAGASIVITGNGETYGGTGTGSALAFAVHGKEATYTVTTSIDGVSAASQTVTTPATSGQSTSLTFTYGTINLTYANDFRGLSITCSDGNKTITKTAPSGANIMSFYPPNTGTWIISGTVSGQPYSTEAIVVDLAVAVPANLQTVPEGSTVLPTDDIQTWLECAGITDKAYTTLAEVLADSTTLATLIADNNAMDYLVRSKTWANDWNDVCTEQTHTFSGTSSTDVTLDSLSGTKYRLVMTAQSSNGAGSGLKLQFYDSNNTALVPNMTSATTPSGVVSVSNQITNYEGWKAFSPSQTNGWFAQNSIGYGAGDGIGYEFTSVTSAVKATVSMVNANSTTLKFKIQKYEQSICSNSTAMTYIGLNNYASNTLLADSDWATAICGSTYYNSVLNGKNPTMTDNTTPSGTCFGDSVYNSGTTYYKAFDGTTTSNWSSSEHSAPWFIGYIFDNPICIKKVRAYVQSSGRPKTSKIQGSNDTTNGSDGTWTDIGSFADCNAENSWFETNYPNNNTSYKAVRQYITEGYNPTYASMTELQFYGRIDV